MSFLQRLFGIKSSPAVVQPEPVLDTSRLFRFGSAPEQIYRRQPAVRTVVDFLAKNVAQLTPKLYERVGASNRVEVTGHPLAEILRRPNPTTTPFRHFRDTVADIALHDRAYWLKVRSGNGAVRGVTRIEPPRVEIRKVNGSRQYWLEGVRRIPDGDLVVFPGYVPYGDGVDGVSPMETLRRTLAEEYAAVQHREFYWKNSARQGGVIQRPIEAPQWSKEARERFHSDWQSATAGGRNSGRTAILEDGMIWNPAAFSPHESEYIEGRRLTFQEVARAYAPSLVGLMSDEPKANIESYHRQLYQDVLAPITRSLEDEIELQLLEELESGRVGNMYVEFNLHEKLRGSFEEQAKAMVTAVGVPYLSVNEARAMLNKPRIDDDALDEPVKPLNVLYGGQPAVTVPTEDPGTQLRSLSAKAVPRGPQRRRDDAAERFSTILKDFFDQQERSVLSSLGAKKLPDVDRWNEVLRDRLEAASMRLISSTGTAAAQQVRGVFNPARTVEWVSNRSRIAAEQINEATFDAIDSVLADEGLDGVRGVFEEAKSSRSVMLGLSTATLLIAFARAEAAKQSEEADGRRRTKTWVVTSRNSRHPHLNGETVPVGEPFSNGLLYPGDATGGGDETAGCKCLLLLN